MPQYNAINWFEIPVTDFERAKTFYETIFNIQMPVSEIPGYKMGFFPQGAGVNGAICAGEGYIPSGTGSLLYLNANPDLNLVLDKVIEQEGRILVSKTIIGKDMGFYAFIVDSEGNKIALQSDK
jgi:uncharacterized protein